MTLEVQTIWEGNDYCGVSFYSTAEWNWQRQNKCIQGKFSDIVDWISRKITGYKNNVGLLENTITCVCEEKQSYLIKLNFIFDIANPQYPHWKWTITHVSLGYQVRASL